MGCCFGSEEYANQTNQSQYSRRYQEQNRYDHPVMLILDMKEKESRSWVRSSEKKQKVIR